MKTREKRNLLRAVAAAAVLALLLAGCSGKETETSSVTDNPTVTLNVWHQWASENDTLKKVYDESVSEYEKTHPEIRIHTTTLDTDAYKTKITSEFTGDAGDIDIFFYWGSGAAKKFISADKLLPLNGYLPKDIAGSLVPGSLDSFTYNGKIYALPMYSWYLTLFCNKAVFKEAGAAIPENYDELLDAVEKITAAGKIPIASGARDSWNAALIYQALALREVGAVNINQMLSGAEAFGEDKGYKESAEKVMQLFRMGAFGKSPLDESNDDANSKFQTGEAAMRLTGSWYINTLYNSSTEDTTISLNDVTAVQIPMIAGKGDAEDYCGGFVDGFFANKNTAYKQECADFIAYISEKFGNLSYEGQNGFSAWKTETDSADTNPLARQVRELMKKGKNGVLAWDTALPPAAAQAHNAGVQSLFTAGASADTFMKEQEEAINR